MQGLPTKVADKLCLGLMRYGGPLYTGKRSRVNCARIQGERGPRSPCRRAWNGISDVQDIRVPLSPVFILGPLFTDYFTESAIRSVPSPSRYSVLSSIVRRVIPSQ